MKLGDVLRKERENRSLTVEETASRLGLAVEQYRELEIGSSSIEEWGPRLARIAIKLSKPTSRFISKSGKSLHAKQQEGQCGSLIKLHREGKGMSKEALAASIDVPLSDMELIEDGKSPLEDYGPILLAFSELVDQPIFNLFYPCGISYDRLEDYP